MRLLNSVPFLIAVAIIWALFSYLRPSAQGVNVNNIKLEIVKGIDSGQSLDIKKLRGKYWVMHVFASWCDICKMDLPLIDKIRFRTMVPIVGVAVRDQLPKVKMIKDSNLPYDYVTIDSNSDLVRLINTRSIPETIIIDPEGKIVFRFIGGLDIRSVEQKIIPLINKQEGK